MLFSLLLCLLFYTWRTLHGSERLCIWLSGEIAKYIRKTWNKVQGSWFGRYQEVLLTLKIFKCTKIELSVEGGEMHMYSMAWHPTPRCRAFRGWISAILRERDWEGVASRISRASRNIVALNCFKWTWETLKLALKCVQVKACINFGEGTWTSPERNMAFTLLSRWLVLTTPAVATFSYLFLRAHFLLDKQTDLGRLDFLLLVFAQTNTVLSLPTLSVWNQAGVWLRKALFGTPMLL